MSVNSLQEKKKLSDMMSEYVAQKNGVNVIPRKTAYQQPISQGQARVAEVARQRQAEKAKSVVGNVWSAAGSVKSKQAAAAKASTPTGGTVLTREQILANNINDIIKQMNNIMSQPGQMLSASYSPYYNIYMEQYRENAEKAKANAYAKAVAGSGGYGSSYAILAGQQAYRDTMEGFAELTPSLTQTKGQAMSDLMQQYEQAKALKNELTVTDAEINDTTYSTYATAIDGGWYTGENEAAVRSRLENLKLGNPELDVDKVMEMLQSEWNAANVSTLGESGEVLPNDENVDAGYQYIATVMQESGGSKVDDIENTLRVSLKNGSAGVKLTDAEIDAALEQYRALEKASVKDIKAINKEKYEKALANPGAADLTALGYSAESVAEMTDAEKKQAILDAAGEATKRGELEKTYYPLWMREDAGQTILNVQNGKSEEVAKTLAGIVISFEDGVAAGYMSQQIADRYLEQIAEMAKDTKFYNEIEQILERSALEDLSESDKEFFWKGASAKASGYLARESANALYRIVEFWKNENKNEEEAPMYYGWVKELEEKRKKRADYALSKITGLR